MCYSLAFFLLNIQASVAGKAYVNALCIFHFSIPSSLKEHFLLIVDNIGLKSFGYRLLMLLQGLTATAGSLPLLRCISDGSFSFGGKIILLCNVDLG